MKNIQRYLKKAAMKLFDDELPQSEELEAINNPAARPENNRNATTTTQATETVVLPAPKSNDAG